ncbi:hypothetical protein M8C21_022036 [Ambrosia artemisiifolia]|uniref:Uncharacterized protein n=1 Tax=Ambrosia artemisiifolia TaxID=4212 RepID=A0AAD5GV02_AMBAR|nr:hypothetical protein M8C21_022036 [Ambrosia artemisiifolia]
MARFKQRVHQVISKPLSRKPPQPAFPLASRCYTPPAMKTKLLTPEKSQRKSQEAQCPHLHRPRPPTVQQD